MVKRFGALLANDVAAFAVHAGEVVALLGENGAGKSTLCKILYGYYRPDAGEIRVAGRAETIASPRDARRLGIGMVFQNFSLIPALTVWENVALFLDDLPWVIGPRELRPRMARFAERLRLAVDPRLPVGRLAVSDRQKVEILKQLVAGARVLILDEPTKVLAPQEAGRAVPHARRAARRRLRRGVHHPQAARGDGVRRPGRGDAAGTHCRRRCRTRRPPRRRCSADVRRTAERVARLPGPRLGSRRRPLPR